FDNTTTDPDLSGSLFAKGRKCDLFGDSPFAVAEEPRPTARNSAIAGRSYPSLPRVHGLLAFGRRFFAQPGPLRRAMGNRRSPSRTYPFRTLPSPPLSHRTLSATP